MATKAERLKRARIDAGFESAQEAAEAFSWNPPAYRHHENGTRGFGADAAKKYGRAFKVRAGWLLGLDHVEKDPAEPSPDEDRLVVNGSVEAGAWRTSEHWNDERSFVIEGMPSPVPSAKRFGLVVVGLSMNEFYEPGSVLDCVSIFKDGVPPKTGDHVIVERIRPDGLRELTVKEYREEEGRYWLVPRSTRPDFAPIEYAGPENGQIGDEAVQVIGFVITAYPPRTLDLMRRMGLVKPLT
jgi:phage repressor protein C with HTH and peptisase S24 domain